MRLTGMFGLAAVLGLAVLAGCHSAHIDATISNRTGETLRLIEVDYPSASFGTQTLAPGDDFHYRFKVLGSGPTTVLWTDAANHDHKNVGPTLDESEEGSLSITFGAAGPMWSERFAARSASR